MLLACLLAVSYFKYTDVMTLLISMLGGLLFGLFLLNKSFQLLSHVNVHLPDIQGDVGGGSSHDNTT